MYGIEKRYIIPKRLIKKSTIFEGIGLKELAILILGIIVGLLLFFVFGIFMDNLVFKIIFLLIPIIIAWLLVMPLQYGENLIVLYNRRKKYNSEQKIYYYVRGSR